MKETTEPPTANTDKKVELARNELWAQLSHAIDLRSSQILWTIFGTFWAANAILLVALFTTGDFPENALVGVIVAAVALSNQEGVPQCEVLAVFLRD